MPRLVSHASRALRGPKKFLSEGPYTSSSTHLAHPQYPCFYCSRVLQTESGRHQHIVLSPSCRQAQSKRLSTIHDIATLLTDIAEHEPERELEDLQSSEAEPAGQTEPDVLFAAPNSMPRVPPTKSVSKLAFDAHRGVFVERFPDLRAGAPINDEVVEPPNLKDYMEKMGRLGDPATFDTAELLMTTGLTNAGRETHLKSQLYKGRVPWVNNKSLLADVDRLPHGPEWEVLDIRLDGDQQHPHQKHHSYLFQQSVVDTLREIMANPDFAGSIQYEPRKEWTADDQKCRVYSETYTGDWWWETQESIPDKFATVVPLIIAHDKTQLSTMSGGQSAYPLYLTVGNIDKSVRRKLSSRAMALLAYLPVDKFGNIPKDVERSRLRRELIHRSLETVFQELKSVSKDGVVVLCGDGRYRRAYPIVAGMMLDYEEQAQMAGVMRDRCAKCLRPDEGWDGEGGLGAPRTNLQTLSALRAWMVGEGRGAADMLGLRSQPVWPWWANIPRLDFASCVMPDLLHQLHQGMVRHLLNWTRAAATDGAVDRVFMLMPKAQGLRHFGQGITWLTQWTGRESKEAAKVLLPIIACLDNMDPNFLRFSRALLDFLYRAQASRMTGDDIVRLEKTIKDIHKYKGVLVGMDIFEDNSRFEKIVKLHMLSHFPSDSRRMGTPDGFSTESPEHMHVGTKRAWRASNKVEPTPQMIRFIQRYEALRIHRSRMDSYLKNVASRNESRSQAVYDEDGDTPLCLTQRAAGDQVPERQPGNFPNNNNGISGMQARWDDGEGNAGDEGDEEEQQQIPGRMRTAADVRGHVVYPNPTFSFALKPTAGRVSGVSIVADHRATDLVQALHTFLGKHGSQLLPPDFLPTLYHEYPVWHQLYLQHKALPFDPEWPRRDVVRAHPANDKDDAAFDLALLLDNREGFGIHRYRAVRVRVIFSLPAGLEHLYPDPLVYVELFSPFSHSISPHHFLHSLSQLRYFDGKRRAAVVPALDLAAACHLAPQLKRIDPDITVNSISDILDVSQHFWFNHYYNRFVYHLIEHWRAGRQG